MGLNISREWYGQEQENGSYSPGYGCPPPRRRRRGFFAGRRSVAAAPLIPPVITQSASRNNPYDPHQTTRPMPIYSLAQPVPAPMLPMSYNNYPISPYGVPQYMMMSPQRSVPPFPTPYMSPQLPISMPYSQPTPIQPAYNNIGVPGSILGANPPYSSVPPRLITDWTGGGVISPGFLGPPI